MGESNRYLALADKLERVPWWAPNAGKMCEAADALRARDADYQTMLNAYVEENKKACTLRTRAEAAEAERSGLRHDLGMALSESATLRASLTAATARAEGARRAALEEAAGVWDLAQPVWDAPKPCETIFTCRCCSASTSGWTDGRFASPGWRRVDRIDGPDAICPACVENPTVLDGLREEYPHAKVGDEKGGG